MTGRFVSLILFDGNRAMSYRRGGPRSPNGALSFWKE